MEQGSVGTPIRTLCYLEEVTSWKFYRDARSGMAPAPGTRTHTSCPPVPPSQPCALLHDCCRRCCCKCTPTSAHRSRTLCFPSPGDGPACPVGSTRTLITSLQCPPPPPGWVRHLGKCPPSSVFRSRYRYNMLSASSSSSAKRRPFHPKQRQIGRD